MSTPSGIRREHTELSVAGCPGWSIGNMSLTPRETFCSKPYKFVLVGAGDAQWAGQHEYEGSPVLPNVTGLEITPPAAQGATVLSILMKTLDEGDDLDTVG